MSARAKAELAVSVLLVRVVVRALELLRAPARPSHFHALPVH